MTCPDCGERASGNFCRNCGATLKGRACASCGAELPASGKFCSECGAQARSAARSGAGGAPARSGKQASGTGGDLGWWMAGAGLCVVIVLLGLNVVQDGQAVSAGAPPVPVMAGAAQLTPRGAADDLFNRVMTASTAGDQTTVTAYLPAAIQAYDAARPLDMDGVFHMALLHYAGGDYEASLASAGEMLAEEPNHILALNAAAQACVALGRNDEAAAYYRQLLEHLDAEMARPLPEYQTHQRYFGVARGDAEAFLGGG